MPNDRTRRRFIETGLKSSLVALGSSPLRSAREVWAQVEQDGEPAGDRCPTSRESLGLRGKTDAGSR